MHYLIKFVSCVEMHEKKDDLAVFCVHYRFAQSCSEDRRDGEIVVYIVKPPPPPAQASGRTAATRT